MEKQKNLFMREHMEKKIFISLIINGFHCYYVLRLRRQVWKKYSFHACYGSVFESGKYYKNLLLIVTLK